MPLVKIPGTTHRKGDYELEPAAIECLWRMEDQHYWHRERNGWILDGLRDFGARPPCRVLEVGCGSGAVVRALQLAGYQVTGVDTAEALATKAHERCPAATIVVGDVAALPEYCRGPFDVVGFFDVLEHLEQPAELMKSALRWASPGALVIATVPAMRSLHTVIDDLSGHKLRYEPGQLTQLFESVGLKSVVEHGIFASTLPIQRLVRHASQFNSVDISVPEARAQLFARALRIPPMPINIALGLLVRLERRLGLRMSQRRRGGSILAVGKV